MTVFNKATTPILRNVVSGICFVGLILGEFVVFSVYRGSMDSTTPSCFGQTFGFTNTGVTPTKTETATFALG